MDEKVRQTYLFDFYGELLNEHQRRIYEDYCANDLTLSEIAAEEGISRQAVTELVKRCGQKLEGYESKLHLLERFLSVKSKVQEMRKIAQELGGASSEQRAAAKRLVGISDQIIEEL